MAAPSGPLHALFLRAWTTPGFAESMVPDPRPKLAEAGLTLSDDVTLAVFGWREEVEHLCWSCQLAVPGVYATLGARRTKEPLGPLDAIFSRTSAPRDAREALDALGLSVAANVRVSITTGTVARLELQLCEAHHACLCSTPELEPIVFANWPS
jgi:hypothetical protein